MGLKCLPAFFRSWPLALRVASRCASQTSKMAIRLGRSAGVVEQRGQELHRREAESLFLDGQKGYG